jgi:hypothetical protein
MFGDIFEGATKFGASYIGGKKRLERRDQAQTAYDTSLGNYFAQDTSNLQANRENTMEDLTVNTQAADFTAQQQNQGLSNIMGSMSQAAGGSGIASLSAVLSKPTIAKCSASVCKHRTTRATKSNAGSTRSRKTTGVRNIWRIRFKRTKSGING